MPSLQLPIFSKISEVCLSVLSELRPASSASSALCSIALFAAGSPFPLPTTATLAECGLKDGSELTVLRCQSAVATASSDHTARLWNLDDGKCIHTLVGHEGAVNMVCWSRDGTCVLTASADGTAKIWNVESGLCTMTFLISEDIYSVNFSPDGRSIITACGDCTAILWCMATGEQQVTLTGHEGIVTWADFNLDGCFILTKSNDFSVKIWSIDSCDCILSLRGSEEEELVKAYFSSDGKFVLATHGTEAHKWNIELLECVVVFSGHQAEVFSAKSSPGGSLVVTASADGTAKMWDANTGEHIRTFACESILSEEDWISDDIYMLDFAAFSPDGKVIATCSLDGVGRLFDVFTGDILSDLRYPSGRWVRLTSVSFSRDGQKFAVALNPLDYAGTSHESEVWSVTGGCTAVLAGHSKPVNWVSLCP